MHSRKSIVNGFVAVSLLISTHQLSGQEKFNIPDVNPSRFQRPSQNTTNENTFSRRGTEPNSDSNIATRPAIFDNDLRSQPKNQPASNFSNQPSQKFSGSNFDRQPLPPQQRSSQSRASQQTGSYSQQPTQLQDRSNYPKQNPLKALNPNRLAPVFQAPNQGKMLPPVDQNPAAQSNNQIERIPTVPARTNDQPATTPKISNSFSDSSDVAATSFSSPQQPAVTNNSDATKNLIAQFEVSSYKQPLPGVPVPMRDLMASTPVRYRMAMVQQHWETYFDWATLLNRRSHAAWLNQIPNPRTHPEQLLLQTAKSMAQNEVTSAEIQLSKSQSKLQQLTRTKNRENLLPLPLNQPLVTKYNTHYDWYESRNMIPAKLKGVNEMLPRTHELISSRATTVTQALAARDQAKQAFSGGQIAISNLLESGRVWRSARQAFVATVVNYNQAISDYALSITPTQKPLDDVVSMLVAKPKTVNEVAQRNSVLLKNSSPVNTQPQQRLAQQPRDLNRSNGASNFRSTQSTPAAANRPNLSPNGNFRSSPTLNQNQNGQSRQPNQAKQQSSQLRQGFNPSNNSNNVSNFQNPNSRTAQPARQTRNPGVSNTNGNFNSQSNQSTGGNQFGGASNSTSNSSTNQNFGGGSGGNFGG